MAALNLLNNRFTRLATVAGALLIGAGLPGCIGEGSGESLVPSGLTSLRLTVLSGKGSSEAPLDLSDTANQAVKVKVEALDADGLVQTDYKGTVRFTAETGLLKPNGSAEECRDDSTLLSGCVQKTLDLAGQSSAEVELTLIAGLGDVKIVAQDVNTYVMGASDSLSLPVATFRTVQQPLDPSTSDASPWIHQYIRFEKGTFVVTEATTGAVYLTDVSDDASLGYNHMNLYTRGLPDLSRGDVLSWVGGTVSEYYKFTEMSFTNYHVKCYFHALPDPVVLTSDMLNDDVEMEKHESGLVEVRNVHVGTVDSYSWSNYGQWPAVLEDGKGSITVLSNAALPDFDPNEFKTANGTFTRLVGNLKQHRSAKPTWILVPRDACDVYGVGERDAGCDAAMPETTCKD